MITRFKEDYYSFRVAARSLVGGHADKNLRSLAEIEASLTQAQ